MCGRWSPPTLRLGDLPDARLVRADPSWARRLPPAPRVRAWLPSARVAHVRSRGSECWWTRTIEACAAHVERAVAEEASEDWEGPGEYHLPEPVDPVGEGLACLDEASRPCRREKFSLGSYAESVHAHGEAYPSSEELVVEDVV